MRITESTLRKIIREELEAAMNEADDGFQIGSIKGGFGKEFGSRLQQMLAIKADLKKDLKRDPTPEELRKAMRAAGMRDPGEEAPMEEVIKKGELDRNQLRAQRQIHAAIQNMHKRNPKRARRIIDYLEREVPPKYMAAIKNAAQGNVRAVDAARALLDLAKSAVPPKRSMEEADVQLNTYSGDLEGMEEAFDTENADLFNLVVKAGIPMTSADRKAFFADYLRSNGYTTADIINKNRYRIAGELKKNRARLKAKK